MFRMDPLMRFSSLAKAHKRATKKEKLGFTPSTSSGNPGTAAVRNGMVRHAPISATMTGRNGGQAVKSAANQRFEDDTAARTAIEQRAAKLLLEAEKRDAERRGDIEVDDGEDADMDAETQAVSLKKLKSTAGAGGMKKKLARRKAQGKVDNAAAAAAPKRDYVDML